MKYGKCFILVAAVISTALAEEVSIKAEKAVVITFPSQHQRTYRLLAATSSTGSWTSLQEGIVGTGGEVTIFYKSEADQKLFFKVETSNGPPGQRSLLSLANLNISNKDLTGYELAGQDLRGFNFFRSKFDNANLIGAILSEANFSEVSMSGADLSHAIAVRVNFQGANFQGANLEEIEMVGCYAGFADFRNANLRGLRFDGTVLQSANFAGQTLTNMSFRAAGLKWIGSTSDGLKDVDFTGANLSGADLSRNSANNLKLEGANITGVNFEGSDLNGVSLKARDLRTVFLRGIAAYNGDWTEVNAAGNDLTFARLGPEAVLNGANFENGNLEWFGIGNGPSPFSASKIVANVSFREANLQGAYLSGVTFQNCNFTGADLSFANVVATSFPGCVGLDPEQPGMQFGPGPALSPGQPNPPGTILPDGTVRLGTNPGTGLAPAMLPERLLLSVSDHGEASTLELAFNGATFSHGTGGAPQGNAEYEARGRGAILRLKYTTPPYRFYNLLFTSVSEGQLFSADQGAYLIGTFKVLQPE